MIASARLQAAIEVLGDVLQNVKNGGRAADDLLRVYFRNRRYAGSKDRRAVGEHAYNILRNFQRIEWVLGKGVHKPRDYFIAFIALSGEVDETLFGTGGHGPEALSADELAFVKRVKTLGEPPLYARVNCPEWLMPFMEKRFKGEVEEELSALNQRAPLDIRINTHKYTRGKALDLLIKEQHDRAVTPHSSLGIRLPKAPNIKHFSAYREGLIEIQDEASQIASILTCVNPGNIVIDLCAGGGGKSLAMANLMKNEGVIYALDTSDKRLKSLSERAKRASAKIIKPEIIEGFDKVDVRRGQLAKFKTLADVVVLDVPCSGTGTWRRDPELRLRLSEESLREFTKTQMRLMEEGARLLKPGGRLVYMTCSLLSQENEEQITAFLKKREPWRLLGAQKIWVEALGGDKLKNLSTNLKCFQLTPHSNGTDGFFIGVLKKPNIKGI